MPCGEVHYLTAHLQAGHVGVQQHSVHAPDLEAYLPVGCSTHRSQEGAGARAW